MADAQPEQVAGTSASAVSKEELDAADAMFLEAMSLRDTDPERAIELFARVLEPKVKAFGDCIQTAPIYLRYGIALLEQARDATDVFGEQLQNAAEQQELNRDSKTENQDPNQSDYPRSSAGPAAGATGPSSASGVVLQERNAGNASAAQPEVPRPAQPSTEGQQEEEGGEEGEEGDDEGEECDEDEEDALDEEEGAREAVVNDDMALAWEMLEMARLLFTEANSPEHLSPLAVTHLSLGDLLAELGQFETAIEEYQKCLECLSKMPEDKRRIAEAHFKLCTVLEFADQLRPALDHVTMAIKLLSQRKEEVEEAMDQPVEGESEEQAEAAIEKLEMELEQIEGALSDLATKAEELQHNITAEVSMKEALATAMKLMTDAEEAAESGLGKAPRDPNAAVQDLGTVGRGKGRITLQPVAAPNSSNLPSAPAAGGPQAKPVGGKRSLEEIMGGLGVGGVTTIGFGNSSSIGGDASKLAPLDAMMAKRRKKSESGQQAAEQGEENKGASA